MTAPQSLIAPAPRATKGSAFAAPGRRSGLRRLGAGA